MTKPDRPMDSVRNEKLYPGCMKKKTVPEVSVSQDFSNLFHILSDSEYFNSNINQIEYEDKKEAKKVQWATPLFQKKLFRANSILSKKKRTISVKTRNRATSDSSKLSNKEKGINPVVKVKKVTVLNNDNEKIELKIGYLNANGWTNKLDQIIEYVKHDKLDLMAIVETHHYSHMGNEWKNLWDKIGFRCENIGRDFLLGDKKGGGIMWAWRSSLNARIWKTSVSLEGREWTQKERLWLQVEWPEYKLAIGAVYMACESPKNVEWNDNLYECLTEEIVSLKMTHKVVLVGDFNGRIGNGDTGVKNGDPVRNSNGDRLLDFTRRNDLAILNREDVCTGIWTRTFEKQRSTIDYFLVENANLRKATKMNIHDGGTNETGSDHNWMDMILEVSGIDQIDRSQKPEKLSKPKWNISEKTDWDKFELEMDKVFTNQFRDSLMTENMNIDDTGRRITDAICKVARSTIGMKRKKPNRRKLPRDVVDAIKERKNARKTYACLVKSREMNLDRTKEAWERYLECKRVAGVRKAIHRKSINTKTCERITNAGRNSSKLFWNETKKDSYKPGISELLVDNCFITEKFTIAQEIENHFCDLGKAPVRTDEDWIEFRDDGEHDQMEHNYVKTHDLNEVIASEHNYCEKLPSTHSRFWAEETGRKFTKKEVMRHIKKLKLGKAFGDDKIPNEFLKYGGHGLWACLVTLLNAIRDKEQVPEIWNRGNISLIHKGGVHYLLDNYRGITIMCTIGKLLSSILRERLSNVIERENLLGEIQNGFRAGRSTEDNLLILRHVIEKSKEKGEKCFLSFIDLRKAYDRVWREGLWEKLENLGLLDY